MTSRIRISGTEFHAVVRRNSTFAKKLVPLSFDVFHDFRDVDFDVHSVTRI
ncbi:MAG: hypothetical protein L6V79_02185 [Clostridium sp.]|nr:MAG: hypothetical protein L6V79_02185 [Clostridium sp.]